MASVMSFSKEEWETLIHYDYISDTYSIETNVPKHINIIMSKYSDFTPIINCVNQNGNPTSVIVRGLPNVITFRSISAIGKVKNKNLGK